MIHFEYYPNIEYSNNVAKNILVRGKIRDVVLQEAALYYKYTVDDNMRPEIISHKYYGSPNYVWAIYYANNIFDPVNEWVRSEQQMDQYLRQKYGNIESTMRLFDSAGKISWDNVHHFEEYDPIDKKTYIIDRKTFEVQQSIGNKNVKAVTLYEYEMEENRKKRDIIVLDKSFLMQIMNEMRNLFSES